MNRLKWTICFLTKILAPSCLAGVQPATGVSTPEHLVYTVSTGVTALANTNANAIYYVNGIYWVLFYRSPVAWNLLRNEQDSLHMVNTRERVSTGDRAVC